MPSRNTGGRRTPLSRPKVPVDASSPGPDFTKVRTGATFTPGTGHGLDVLSRLLPTETASPGLGAGGYFFLPLCLIVSTTWVLGLLLAVFTDVNRPLPALRPIFAMTCHLPPWSVGITRLSFPAIKSEPRTYRCASRASRNPWWKWHSCLTRPNSPSRPALFVEPPQRPLDGLSFVEGGPGYPQPPWLP
jgi:hypothetical protein